MTYKILGIQEDVHIHDDLTFRCKFQALFASFLQVLLGRWAVFVLAELVKESLTQSTRLPLRQEASIVR